MKTKEARTGCIFCSGKNIQGIFVPPEIPNRPDLIIIGEAPGETEKQTGKPFQGESGQILRNLLEKLGARAIIVNARNCYHPEKPTTLEIKGSREKHLEPILKHIPLYPLWPWENMQHRPYLEAQNAKNLWLTKVALLADILWLLAIILLIIFGAVGPRGF